MFASFLAFVIENIFIIKMNTNVDAKTLNNLK